MPALWVSMRAGQVAAWHQPKLSLWRQHHPIHQRKARFLNTPLRGIIINPMTKPEPFRLILFPAQDGLEQVRVNAAPAG